MNKNKHIICNNCGAGFTLENTYCNFYACSPDSLLIRYFCKNCEDCVDAEIKSPDDFTEHEVKSYILFRLFGQAVTEEGE